MGHKKKRIGFLPFLWFTLLGLIAAFVFLGKGHDWLQLLDRTPDYKAFGVAVPAEYSITGIDVSRYQGKIDWKKVKKMRSGKFGVGFAFAKATEGLTYEDTHYGRNRKQCKKHGIPFGAYHYFIPGMSAVKQADFFASRYMPQKGDLPPVADIEKTGNLTPAKLRGELQLFLDRVELKTGVKPIIYSYHSFYRDYLHGQFDDYTFWVAHYGPGKPHDQPWTFWQFSEKSTVSGINHKVDLNVFKGDSAAFKKLLVK